jgi:gluconokinase
MPAKPGDKLPSAIIIMGVCGTGKSTVGIQLADTLGWPFADADDFHPPTNVAKMRAGTPLNDADRTPWLDTLRDHLRAQAPTVLACSALKRQYRDRLRTAAAGIRFVYLHGDRDLLATRLGARAGHYMPSRHRRPTRPFGATSLNRQGGSCSRCSPPSRDLLSDE